MLQVKLQFKCNTCTAQQKEVRGCFTKSRAPIMAHGIKGSVNMCPVIDYFDAGQYLAIHRYWRNGNYPNTGTWAEQPYKLVKIMEYIDGTLGESIRNPDLGS